MQPANFNHSRETYQCGVQPNRDLEACGEVRAEIHDPMTVVGRC